MSRRYVNVTSAVGAAVRAGKHTADYFDRKIRKIIRYILRHTRHLPGVRRLGTAQDVQQMGYKAVLAYVLKEWMPLWSGKLAKSGKSAIASVLAAWIVLNPAVVQLSEIGLLTYAADTLEPHVTQLLLHALGMMGFQVVTDSWAFWVITGPGSGLTGLAIYLGLEALPGLCAKMYRLVRSYIM